MSVELLSVIDADQLRAIRSASGRAVPHADTPIERIRGMKVRDLSAASMSPMAPSGAPQELSREEATALDEAIWRARGYLAAVERQLSEQGVKNVATLRIGAAHDEIVAEAQRSGATMIAMTGRSKHFWERGALGSTADRVVRTATIPVLVFKPMPGLSDTSAAAPDAVVVGLDGSKEAEMGLRPAADLAHSVGARLVLARVVEDESESRRQAAARYLGKIAARLTSAFIDVEYGNPDEEIIRFADGFSRPLIAVTERGGGRIDRWFRGSTTDKLIRNSGYPVLVSPAMKVRARRR
jgi:nucleotide-binding universal stress UspA family protein